jgi:hypothetical protein
MSAEADMAIYGTIYCAAVALVMGLPVLVFGGTSVALAVIGMGWVFWIGMCGLARLVSGLT